MMRRGFRRGIIRQVMRPDVPPMLKRAHELMASGNYPAAAEAFEQLAHRSENRFPQRTPFLYLEAGRAAILSGQTKIGLAHLRRGLTLFATQGRFARMQAFGQRAVDELNVRSLTAEAAEIAALLDANLPQAVRVASPAAAAKPILPTHCPACGAPIRPDEVEWLDKVTAECGFCGSPVRAED